MAVNPSLLQAKQALSGRLLRAALRGGAFPTGPTFHVAVAVSNASANVHAVGVGRKIVNGVETAQEAVRLYVIQKLPTSLLSPRDVLPDSVDGIPTDVIESPPAFLIRGGPPPCSVNRRKRQRPVVAGISTAHGDVTAGTIAYFCHSTRHGDDPRAVHALTNNHVYANVNKGIVGDDLFQPGPMDGALPADHFAELHRFVPIQLGGAAPNRVDAAIGQLLAGVDFLPQICSIGPISGTALATEDLLVRKHGRNTGYTEGRVEDESYDTIIRVDHQDPTRVALFVDQMRIETVAPFNVFGLDGDSGSLVVAKAEPLAVGLYFAGSLSGVYGVVNHIANVLSELEIRLV